MTFTIKQNDTLPSLEAQLIDYDNNPINLDLCGVKFYMMDGKGAKKVKVATISDTINGSVRVDWETGDTSAEGIYRCEFEINTPDGKVITVPNDGYFLISIIREIA